MKTRRKGTNRLLLSQTVSSLHELTYSDEFAERARQRPNDFTRSRKMGLPKMIAFMMNLVRTSTQTALDRFFPLLGEQTRMTQQSFSEARKKLRPEACRMILDNTAEMIYAHGYDTWHGHAVIAIDGSKIQLPDDRKLLETFSGMGPGAASPTAQASIAYDVLNNVVVDAEIEPLSTDERTLAERHIRHISAMPGLSNALLVFDRGYPSAELMSLIAKSGLKFLMRVRRKFNLVIDALGDGVHDIVLPSVYEDTLAVRIIKFALPSGETETLVTNLTDKRLGIEAFKQLYSIRWLVETKYGEVKLKLEAENFSGRTEQAVRQDFYITTALANLVSIAVNEAQPVVDQARENKSNKHKYKVNVNHVIGSFKDRFILALLDPNNSSRADKVAELVQLLAKHVVPVRQGRHVPRNPSPRKSRFHYNMKSNC